LTEKREPLLKLDNLETGYGKKQVVFGASLEVQKGEVVALIGPNGAGKSTILKAVCGLIPVWKGEIRFEGVPTNGSSPAQNVARGITFAPQGNRVFDELTVLENLEIGGFQLPSKELKVRIEEVMNFFPILRERRKLDASKLSGGEKQMLALARALVPKPKLLMLDEPSLGLAPNLVSSVFGRIAQLNRETGVTILIVEQKVRDVLRIAHCVYGLRLGKIALEGPARDVDPGMLKKLFLS
jgi:branched-chain amino acid transport system ATP-binding protein